MPEDGQYDRNMLRVLTGVIQFVMPDGIRLSFFKTCVRLWGFGAEVQDGDSMYLRQDSYGGTTQNTTIQIIRVDKKFSKANKHNECDVAGLDLHPEMC